MGGIFFSVFYSDGFDTNIVSMCVVYGFFMGFVLCRDLRHDLVYFLHNGVVVLEGGRWVESDLWDAAHTEL